MSIIDTDDAMCFSTQGGEGGRVCQYCVSLQSGDGGIHTHTRARGLCNFAMCFDAISVIIITRNKDR